VQSRADPANLYRVFFIVIGMDILDRFSAILKPRYADVSYALETNAMEIMLGIECEIALPPSVLDRSSFSPSIDRPSIFTYMWENTGVQNEGKTKRGTRYP